jgi:hypothetical protein
MMRASLLIAILLLSPIQIAYADVAHADEDGYAVPAYKLAKVAKVTVRTASASDESGKTEDCSKFIITPKAAKFFLNHAKPVSQRARTHDYTVSYCYAEGDVKFVNGERASWTIVHGGTGLMTPKSGKFKDQVISLHCAKCDDMDM